MDDSAAILLEKRQGVVWVTLNRPRVLNAYNVQMRDQLHEALDFVDADPEVLAAVFRGAGDRAFCAGADLTEFGSAPSQAIARRVRFERDIWDRFLGITKPLIAAIHGFCFGSGLEIALCCDFRLCSPEAVFGLPEAGLGMVPAAAGTQTLPRHVGVSRALHYLLTGARMDADAARRAGIVTRVVPRDGLFDEAGGLADSLCSLDQGALRLIKETVNRGLDVTLGQGLELERRAALRWMNRVP